MRRKNSIALLCAVCIASGCSIEKEQPDVQTPRELRWTTHAIQKESDTKTALVGRTLSWTPGDRIGIFISGLQFNRQFVNSEGNTFEGGILPRDEQRASVDYYAYYPYVSSPEPSTTVNATLVEDQLAPFDPSANWMVADVVSAKYDEDNMPDVVFQFNHQLMSIIKVTVTNTDASIKDQKLYGIELVAESGETLTGSFTFDITSPSANPVFSDVASEFSNKVKSTYASSSRPSLGLNEPHVVYVLVNPTTVTSLKLVVKTTDYAFVITSNVETNFEKGTIVNLPTVDLKDRVSRRRVRTIVTWGDSIFNGFPKPLQDELGDDWDVINAGVGGDTPLQIAGRQGGIPMCLQGPFTIPADNINAASVGKLYSTRTTSNELGLTEVGKEAWYTEAKSQLNPCSIIYNDVEVVGTMIIDGSTCSFKRSVAGEVLNVPEGATVSVVSHGAKALRNADVIVIDMGGNGGYTSNEVLTQFFQSLITYSYQKRFVIIGYHFATVTINGIPKTFWTTDYRDTMRAAFNSNYIDMWTIGTNRDKALKLLKATGAYSQSATTFTAKDDQALSDGYWPESFASTSNYTDVHLGAFGYKAMAILIREKMDELGYLDF